MFMNDEQKYIDFESYERVADQHQQLQYGIMPHLW